MQRPYTAFQQQSQLSYGETLKNVIDPTQLKGKKVIILTNQKYYDWFFEKLSQLFSGAQQLDWYICTNQLYCNQLSELADLLDFLADFPQDQPYLFCAFGNEGVMQLTGFLQKTAVLPSEYWCLPVSIRSLAKVLVGQPTIVKATSETVLRVNNLPQQILYDQTIVEEQVGGKLVDFLIFIRCGLVCSHDFLQQLYQNFPTQKLVYTRSFTALLADLIDFYQTSSPAIEGFGQLFASAFYQTEQGHLLSANMKRLQGIIFQLLWSAQVNALDFKFHNFFLWLQYLGYPLTLPPQLSLNDYGQQILQLAEISPACGVLAEIGQIDHYQKPTEAQLVKTFTAYQDLMAELSEI